ncbi:MAG: methyltransferase [Epulopiscium sp. Nuni2H_MBin003]|nr:MAG: methyltransferase [Epulopiscium sp. Nuni2H_MBin003]
MKVEWDYTALADAYLKRPDYAIDAIDQMLNIANITNDANICDVGAGAAHLTLILAQKGFKVSAVEPNDAMRANGTKKTMEYPNISWFEGVGENTGMPNNTFDLVTFGSSFNVCDRQLALKETQRILKPHGWFACMWNHRDLADPTQIAIEEIIKSNIAGYTYGTRREDQTNIINESNLFGEVHFIEGKVVHKILASDFSEGWKSHGTLHRQSPDTFNTIIKQIDDYISNNCESYIEVPYITRLWMAQLK